MGNLFRTHKSIKEHSTRLPEQIIIEFLVPRILLLGNDEALLPLLLLLAHLLSGIVQVRLTARLQVRQLDLVSLLLIRP